MSTAPRLHPRFVILMGVSGVGKTTVGSLLARRLGWEFFDADAFHPESNVAKMRRGIPLVDAERKQWLDRLRNLIASCVAADRSAVLACSALKRAYRSKLQRGHDGVLFVYLRAPQEVVEARLGDRKGHYFNPKLLASQYAALEEPLDAVIVDATEPIDDIVDAVVTALRSSSDEVSG